MCLRPSPPLSSIASPPPSLPPRGRRLAHGKQNNNVIARHWYPYARRAAATGHCEWATKQRLAHVMPINNPTIVARYACTRGLPHPSPKQVAGAVNC